MSRQLKREMNKAIKIIFILSTILFLVTCVGVLKVNGFLY